MPKNNNNNEELDAILKEKTDPKIRLNNILLGMKNATMDVAEKYSLEKQDKMNMAQSLKKFTNNITRTSTGIDDFDLILDGGIPSGTIVQIYGKESVGKSSLCMHLASRYEACVYIDAEHSFNKERALQFGMNPETTMVIEPENGEQVIDYIKAYANAKVPLIIVDSVPTLVPEKQLIVDEKDAAGKKAGIALTAGLLSQHLSIINGICFLTGTTIIFVNQLRSKIGGFMTFGPTEYTPGGWALKYALGLDIKLSRKLKMKVSNAVLGIHIACEITKNKFGMPFSTAEFGFICDIGKFISLDDQKKELKEARKRWLEKRKNDLMELGKVETQDEYEIVTEVVNDDEE